MTQNYEHTFYSVSVDSYFGFSEGRLRYRTVYWEEEVHNADYQDNPVVNFTSSSVAYTRVLEHKHFAPWEDHDQTIVFREFSKKTEEDDIPYYPVRLDADKAILNKYIERASSERNTSFIGRLGTYRYLDMDQVIAESKAFAQDFLTATSEERLSTKYRFSADPFSQAKK